MSLYMLLLSCMPCSEGSECGNDEKVSIVMADTDHDHEEEEENCTPFCVCACCAASVSQAPAPIAIRSYTGSNLVNTCHEEDFFSASYGSIWQPPRSC